MRGWIGRIAAATGLALSLLAATPAPAQSPEAMSAAEHVAHDLMSAVDFQAVIAKAARSSATGLGALDEYRPQWSAFALEAINEEVNASGPVLERLIGRKIAKAFTLEELQAGEVIMDDPMIQSAFGAVARGEKAPNKGCGPDCTRVLARPAGQAFLRKLANADAVFGKDIQGDMIAAIMPGFMRRWADKIEAGEKARGG